MKTSAQSIKSQAAMEFLMTYGWAILVVLAAIAALAYFGVLSPAKFLPDKCVLDPGIFCKGYKVESSQITLILSNIVDGRSITVNSITLGGCSGAFSEAMSNDQQHTFILAGASCSNGAVKDKFKGEIVIGYTEKDTGLTKTNYGQLNTKVE